MLVYSLFIYIYSHSPDSGIVLSGKFHCTHAMQDTFTILKKVKISLCRAYLSSYTDHPKCRPNRLYLVPKPIPSKNFMTVWVNLLTDKPTNEATDRGKHIVPWRDLTVSVWWRHEHMTSHCVAVQYVRSSSSHAWNDNIRLYYYAVDRR